MSINIPEWYVRQYADNITHKLQQGDSRLSDKVTHGQYTGEQGAVVDQLESIEMQEVTGRFGDMPRVDADVDRPWVFPTDFDLPQLIDKFDKLRLLTDPESAYVMNAVKAANRKKDAVIVDAFFADANRGKNGGTTVSFPSADQVVVNHASASNTNLTYEKLREARQLLMAHDVDLDAEPAYCAITASQHDALLGEIEVKSLDYNDRPVLVKGKVTEFMGFQFVHTELLGTDGSSYRRVPVWVPSGMHLGMWNNVTTSVTKRNDLRGEPWQAYMYATMGACRVEEGRVIEIKCAES